MTDAVAYGRISRLTDRRPGGAGLGSTRQLDDIRALADRLGWRIAVELVDDDRSAYKRRRREGYERMLSLLRRGEVSAVLGWHPDRLHRSPTELEAFITVVEVARADVATVTAGPLDLSTPSGRLVARQLCAVANYESEHLRERVMRQKEQAAGDGRWLGGRRPFGFEPDGVTQRPDEAAAIRDAYDGLLTGRPLAALARDFTARGLTTSAGNPWDGRAMARLLRRARNAGLVEHRGEVKRRANWPAVVGENTWRAARAILVDETRRTAPTGGARRWLLSGLARCGVCGQPVKAGSRRSGRDDKAPAYTCATGKHIVRDATAVDTFVADLVVTRLGRPDAAALLCPPSADVAALRRRRAALAARDDQLGLMFAEGVLDAGQLREAKARARAKLAEVDAALAAAARSSALAAFVASDRAEAVWERLALDQRRAVLDALGLVVTLLPARRGRPPGWREGDSYFDYDSIEIQWRTR